MPGGDRTGPFGEGPKTGRQMGYCVGRRGLGRGFGPGFRHGYGHYQHESFPDVSKKTLIENEIRILKDQLSALEDRLSKSGEKDQQ